MERLKKIRLNPIIKKDLRVLSRSMKIAWGLFAYEAVLMIVFLFAIWIIFDEFGSYGYSENYQAFVALFPILSVIEFGIIALLMPIMTATAVSGEKERQTFDILLTTVMTPRAIIRGKVGSAVIRVMVFMVASIPLMSLSFTLGGLSWGNLLITMIAFLIFAILTGSFGIFASTLTKKSITAIILTYVFYFVFSNLTFVPTLIIVIVSSLSQSSTISALMLFNPVAAIAEMFVLMLGGDDIFGTNVSGWMGGWFWVILSGAAMIGFSILFQELAAHRIDPLYGYVKDKKKKQQPGVPLNIQPTQTNVPKDWAPGQTEQQAMQQPPFQGTEQPTMQQPPFQGAEQPVMQQPPFQQAEQPVMQQPPFQQTEQPVQPIAPGMTGGQDNG